MMMKLILIAGLFLTMQTWCLGSTIEADSSKFASYQQGFRFKPGIYLHIEAWKSNNPLPKEAIISKYDPDDRYFFFQVLSKRWLRYQDSDGNIHKVETAAIFGYSVDNLVYTKYHTKIAIIGAICHYSNIIHEIADPNLAGLAFITMDGVLDQQSGIRKQEKFRQFMIDFENGNIYRFTERYFKKLIATDLDLYNEYKVYRGKKKEKMYIFLRKYNQRHPIRFQLAET